MWFKRTIYFFIILGISSFCYTQSFKITALPKTQRIIKYQSAGIQINATAIGGFTASVNLSGFSSSLPNASYSYSINPINFPYSNPSIATVSYTNNFPVGKHTLIFRGYNGTAQSLDTVYLDVVESIGTWTVFNASNSGLPNNNITCIQTDKNNNLWIGTKSGGIAKFDGTFWTVYNKSNSGIYSDSISSIAVDSANNIWVSFIYKSESSSFYPTISKFNGSNWVNYKSNYQTSTYYNFSSSSIRIDKDKNIFLLVPDIRFLVKFNGISWTQYSNSTMGLGSSTYLLSLSIDKYGNKWIATYDSGLVKFNGTTWEKFNIANSNILTNYLGHLACDSTGNIWLSYYYNSNYSNNISSFNGTSFTHFNSGQTTNHIEIAPNGTKWLAQTGLTKNDDIQWRNFNTTNSKIHSNNITCSRVDINGNVWVGSSDYGLAKYVETTSATLWLNNITLRDGNGNGTSKTLTFGQDDNATDGLDAQLGELELPPVPPSGNFDARFLLPATPQIASGTDYRNSLSNPITWTMQFQVGVSGYPIKFTWDNTKLPINGNFFLKDLSGGTIVNVNMKNVNNYTLSNTGITTLKIEFSSQQCADFTTSSNWNIVSVPVLTSNMTVQSIFPSAVSQAFYYDNGYIATNTLENSKGYWLKFNTSQSNSICGTKTWSPIPLNTGWNIIGIFENDIPVNQITTSPNGIITSSFFSFENGYNPVTILQKGKGYWVKSSQSGNITVPTLLFSKQSKIPFENYTSDQKVILSDNSGISQTLYFTKEQKDLSQYELPPVPPVGIADIRFMSDRFVESLDKEQIIKLNGLAYPIKLKVIGTDIILTDNINGKLLNKNLKDGEEVVLSNAQLNMLKIKATEIPTEYSLSQNYPNPFNPVTIINYQLPINNKVTIKIFDIMGRLVETLIDELQEPGKYSIEWNANKYASGIYYYELRAGDYRSIKKMMLVK